MEIHRLIWTLLTILLTLFSLSYNTTAEKSNCTCPPSVIANLSNSPRNVHILCGKEIKNMYPNAGMCRDESMFRCIDSNPISNPIPCSGFYPRCGRLNPEVPRGNLTSAQKTYYRHCYPTEQYKDPRLRAGD